MICDECCGRALATCASVPLRSKSTSMDTRFCCAVDLQTLDEKEVREYAWSEGSRTYVCFVFASMIPCNSDKCFW